MSSPPTIGFLACVERGALEEQCLLLCRSIRRWAGRFREAPIYAFQPRAGTAVRPETAAALQDLRIQHVTDVLNQRYASFPLANKVMVCAWAERHLPHDVLVFVDSDSVVLGEPDALELSPSIDAAVRPVDLKHEGSRGPGDPADAFWRAAYLLAGARSEPRVRTTVDGEDIRAYFNSGLIAARRRAGVFGRYQQCFEKLWAARICPEGGMTFLEQVALAMALVDTGERLSILDPHYNYPLPLRALLPRPMAETPLDALVHVHYHRWFQRPGFLREIRPALDPASERFRWLDERLPLHPPIDDPVPGVRA